MRSRDRNEIVASILQSVINPIADDGIRRTRIMYNPFLSYNMVTHYLKLLTENGSLEYNELNKTHGITETGSRVLELHNKNTRNSKGLITCTKPAFYTETFFTLIQSQTFP